MIAVRSGSDGTGQWHREIRNYLEDFRSIVGQDPTQLQFVAVMIDGDNTGSSGTSYFAEIKLWSDLPPWAEGQPPRPPHRHSQQQD